MAFPNFKGKHAHDAMFSPEDFMNYSKKLGNYPKVKAPKAMIFCYQKGLFQHIKENFIGDKIEGFYGENYFVKGTNNQIAVTGNFGIGAPAACAHLEEMIAFGIKEFISIGNSGTLQKDLGAGDLIVCEKSIRDEGTSHHYLKSSKYSYASKEMVKRLAETLDRLKRKYVVGTSWTIDAPYRETVAEARQYQKEGVCAVEMELAALFAVAQYRKVKMGALISISDSLAELQWKPRLHKKKEHDGGKATFEVALAALIK